MTKPLRHRRCEIENAARVAQSMGLAVRLEPNGAITIIPDLPKEPLDSPTVAGGNSLREWRERRDAGKARGRA